MKASTKKSFKKVWDELKKIWAAILQFLWPYRNLDKLMLKPHVEPFLKKHINQVYFAGLIILAIVAILGFISFRIMTILGTWLILIIIFLIFRLACELIAGTEKKEVVEEEKKVLKKNKK